VESEKIAKGNGELEELGGGCIDGKIPELYRRTSITGNTPVRQQGRPNRDDSLYF